VRLAALVGALAAVLALVPSGFDMWNKLHQSTSPSGVVAARTPSLDHLTLRTEEGGLLYQFLDAHLNRIVELDLTIELGGNTETYGAFRPDQEVAEEVAALTGDWRYFLNTPAPGGQKRYFDMAFARDSPVTVTIMIDAAEPGAPDPIQHFSSKTSFRLVGYFMVVGADNWTQAQAETVAIRPVWKQS
jgi:hypothetical protein